MRIHSIVWVITAAGALMLSFAPACAARSASERTGVAEGFSLQGCWRVDHYVYDAALHRNWAVLLDCDHPNVPSHMVLMPGRAKAPNLQAKFAVRTGSSPQLEERFGSSSRTESTSRAEVRTGAQVVVASGPASLAVFALPGLAEETAFAGDVIRVRLKLNGAIVRAKVRGPHLVELVSGAKSAWGKP